VWRANFILATADGCGTAEIMRRSGKSKPVVWTWQARFMAEGVEGLLRDKTRKPGKPPLPPNTVQRVVDLALGRLTRGTRRTGGSMNRFTVLRHWSIRAPAASWAPISSGLTSTK